MLMISKQYLLNAVYATSTILDLLRNIQRQQVFLKSSLIKEVEASRKTNDKSLTEKDFNKITYYYGLGGPAITGEAFCLLRGQKMSLKERYAISYQAAITGLFDDFFDERDLPAYELKAFLEYPEQAKARNTHEQLFLKFYQQALAYATDKGLVKYYLNQGLEAQVWSKRQMSSGLSEDEVQKITLSKGGAFLLIYRSMFSHQMGKKEEEMLYQMGGLLQLGNDIFDVYKDYLAGIQTLMTIATKVDEVRLKFLLLMEKTYSLAHKTNYPSRNVYAFLRYMSMFICRTFVCLDMLEKNEALTNGVFMLDKYRREQLICDMENPINILKSINYHLNCQL